MGTPERPPRRSLAELRALEAELVAALEHVETAIAALTAPRPRPLSRAERRRLSLSRAHYLRLVRPEQEAS